MNIKNIKNIKYGKNTKIGRIVVIVGVLLILLSVSVMTGDIANIPMAAGFAMLLVGIVMISVDIGFSNWFVRR